MARLAMGAVEKAGLDKRPLAAPPYSPPQHARPHLNTTHTSAADAKAGKAAPPSGAATDTDRETRVGPDPLTLILPALAALGGIVSIASLNWAARDGEAHRRLGRRNAVSVLRNLERDCLDLQEAFRRLVRGLPGITSGGGTTALPMKFGVHGLDVTPETYPIYQSLLASLSSLVARTCQHSYDLMGAIEDGSIEPPESLFFAFGDQQERLNQLLGVPRPSLKATVETGYDIAVKLSALIDELGAHRRD